MKPTPQLYSLLCLGKAAIEQILDDTPAVLQNGTVMTRSGIRIQKDQTLKRERNDQIVVRVHLVLQSGLQDCVVSSRTREERRLLVEETGEGGRHAASEVHLLQGNVHVAVAASFRLLPVDHRNVNPDLPFRCKELQQQVHIGNKERLQRVIGVLSHKRVDDDGANGLSELSHEQTQRLDVDFVDDT